MIVPFNTLPTEARVWIYQANRELTETEIEEISKKAEVFIESWTRHGEDLKASYEIKYNQFLVLAVDESFNDVSGCSIDSSVRFIKSTEQSFGIDLMNKLNIAFKIGENINTVSLSAFQQYIKEEKIDGDTIVFNNMVQSVGEYQTNWEVPANQSWHQRFIPVAK
ncbi:MAG: ABC transporter ATPase [Flavobacteriaceae bacterium]|nr:MAG: ABC transporter ATPase [Flavobacteriaceae bacterium]